MARQENEPPQREPRQANHTEHTAAALQRLLQTGELRLASGAHPVLTGALPEESFEAPTTSPSQESELPRERTIFTRPGSQLRPDTADGMSEPEVDGLGYED